MEDSNPSQQASVHDLSSPARRQWLQGGLGAAMGTLLAPLSAGLAGAAGVAPSPRLGFKGIAPSTADAVVVPEGYVAQALAPWGDAVGLAGLPAGQPAFKPDAANSAAEQAQQFGMHHDGLHFFALPGPDGAPNPRHGLLVINHEYTDDGLLHPTGLDDWNTVKVAKAQAAHGMSVSEWRQAGDGAWQAVRPSPYARRITANTPCALQGPAAGHPLMRTEADPAGRTVLGTAGNCAAGQTPWGTFLSGEENWANYFRGPEQPTADQKRWGIGKGEWYRWAAHDARFDTSRHPNEFHRFGWVVELDPMDPDSPPIKRTALGRGAHEGAWVAVTRDQRAVVYSGEDARFEYIYKFVSRDRIALAGPGKTAAQANRTLLDHGTLYVARFDADGTGRWLPLVHGQGPLTAANGFADQGEVLIKTRQASDLLGATRMDRPEWMAIDPQRREVFCSLTNNRDRGAPGFPGVDAANPRASNTMGQIIRWQEDVDFDATTLRWSHLMLAGNPASERPELRGNIQGDLFACPDTLAIDARGVLWIGCDVSPSSLNKGEMAAFGNNQLLACDPATGEVRRFLAGPRGCEITGSSFSPDMRTLFINVQHPGETPSERSNWNEPQRFSTWPDGPAGGRPRSATVAIRRRDGGIVGA